MGRVTPQQVNFNDTADSSDINIPINQLAAEINGNLDSSNIKDNSIGASKLAPDAFNFAASTAGGWTPLGYTATFVQNNGNKETVVNYAGDLTNILSPGMKVAYTRSVAPPTQCMAFTASSSQYATKASPTGTWPTTAFTIEGWITPGSYSQGFIWSRTDNSFANGLGLRIQASGQLDVLYASGGLTTEWQSALSLPLRKVHVAAVVSNISGKTLQGLYIDGSLVSATSVSSNAAALTNAGNVSMGTYGTGVGQFFNGLVSELRVWSTARTQAEILANMNNNLTGSESGLVGLWRGAGNFNDLTANANHLTATNGAIATQNANPFNLIEYGKVTKVGAFSGGVTPVTVFTGTDCNIPNMALTSPLYSNVANPYGFPAARSKWQLTSIYMVGASVNSPVPGTWYNLGSAQISPGAGQWELSGKSTSGGYRTSPGGVETVTTLSTSPTTATNQESSSWGGTESGFSGIGAGRFPLESRCDVDQQTQTTWYLNTKTNTSSLVDLNNYGAITPTIITAKLAY